MGAVYQGTHPPSRFLTVLLRDLAGNRDPLKLQRVYGINNFGLSPNALSAPGKTSLVIGGLR